MYRTAHPKGLIIDLYCALLQVLVGILRYNGDYISIANDKVYLDWYVKYIDEFLKKHDLDGVDLRWDYSSKG